MASAKQLVWLITGTSSGFGRELALSALSRGDKVIATARGRSVKKLGDLKAEGADVLELDVTAPLEQLKEIAKKAHDIHGKIDVLVNNAGYVLVGALEENTPEETFQSFNTMVFGALNVARAVLPYMRARRKGTVVWIGSLAGWSGIVNAGIYTATKYALRGIGETMHAEISPLGLRSLVIEPGYFRTALLSPDNRAPQVPRIDDYNAMTQAANETFLAYAGNQPGDPKKAAEIIVDVVRLEGVAEDKAPPIVLQLGSDCRIEVENACKKALEEIEEWKDVIISTDLPK